MPEQWETCQRKLLTRSWTSQRERQGRGRGRGRGRGGSVAVSKAERSWRSAECIDIRHGDAESGVCLAGFQFVLVQYFLTMMPSGMVIYILCHYMVEVCDLFFEFDLRKD
jgi:hypothetical protein